MEDFIIKHSPEFIYFLQHPEKHDHYLIIQMAELAFEDLYTDFNRTGKHKDKPLNVFMPYNRVKLVEKISVPDRNLFGLSYFITHEIEQITYEKDERYEYGEWGWYIIKKNLDTSKWLQQYLTKQQEKKNNDHLLKTTPQQISLF
ncbi:MAG: hypothetical protein JO072_03230 [Parafilimonas sp.]|nr:hypothetical protein [Parafilimonas sp.]